ILSIYLVLDGERLINWLRTETPRAQRPPIVFLLSTLERVVGGYIRGQLILSTIIGALVGGGMELFHVPDPLLLGMLAFLLAFIPILGTFVSGAACVLLALTQGITIAIAVLAYFVFIHVIEGDVLGPRIVGEALGLHPVLSILAVVTGAELFGITGALFAGPLTGVALAIVKALWASWQKLHPHEFSPEPRNLAVKAAPAIEDESGEAAGGS
ncbi:MAG: AI-2E family transporter, partial [Acetobacteraceae bacterium]